MDKSSIVVNGVISRISYKNIHKGLVNFEIANNREYLSRDGYVNKDTSFFSAIIDLKVLDEYKNLLKVGNKVVVTGQPRSYFDKEKKKCFSIRVNKIIDERLYHEEEYSGSKLSFDKDGVMLWNGKRCEATPMNHREEKELREMLEKY